jgi:hypothetical protein
MRALYGGIAGAVLFAASAQAAIVNNGSFETGDFSGWTVSKLSGTTPGTGPQVITTGGSNSTGYGDNVPVYQGTHAAFFVDDNAVESISQSVSLAANQTYTLSFGLFATQSGAANPFSFTLADALGSDLINTYTNQNSPAMTQVPVGVWTTETGTFTSGAAGNYTLSFNFTAGPTPAKDLLLDGVSLSSVPLPASAPMFGAALAALGAIGYGLKRKKAAAAA